MEDQKEYGDIEKYEERHPVTQPGFDERPNMVVMAMQKGYTPELIEKMMDLAERNEKNEARKAYVSAMARFKENPPEIDKDQTVKYAAGNKTTEYRHASLANVTTKINAALAQQGLSAAWETKQDNGTVTVTCAITHEMGHSESTSLTAAPDATGSKNAIQAIGSTISYLERYTILALTGLATHDMDNDGQGDDPEYITEKQLNQIIDMINDVGADELKFLEYMNAKKPELILARDFEKSMVALKVKGKAKK